MSPPTPKPKVAFYADSAVKTADSCEANNVSVRALLKFWRDDGDFWAAALKRHVASCNDPDCGNECRVARGLPPLTREQRRALGW